MLCIGTTCLLAQDTVRITDSVSLRPYLNQTVTVVGRIVQVTYSPKTPRKPTFLNMHKPFPKNPFTLTVFEDERILESFPSLKETYEGKMVEITGLVREFESAPDKTGVRVRREGITIKTPQQIRLVQ